eukprot:7737362-Pyramimonas_sp.AAC.1
MRNSYPLRRANSRLLGVWVKGASQRADFLGRGAPLRHSLLKDVQPALQLDRFRERLSQEPPPGPSPALSRLLLLSSYSS